MLSEAVTMESAKVDAVHHQSELEGQLRQRELTLIFAQPESKFETPLILLEAAVGSREQGDRKNLKRQNATLRRLIACAIRAAIGGRIQ